MIVETVKRLWGSNVSVRSYRIDDAKKSGDDIKIIFGDKYMIIPNAEIDKKLLFRTASYPDKIRGGEYQLCNFKWVPKN